MSETCQYHIKVRNRRCKFPAAGPGEKYCATHRRENAEGKRRVACTLDGRHTVYEDVLRKHLAKCPRARDICFECLQPFYNENCNSPVVNAVEFEKLPADEAMTYEHLLRQSGRVPKYYQLGDVGSDRSLSTVSDRRKTKSLKIFPSDESCLEWGGVVSRVFERVANEWPEVRTFMNDLDESDVFEAIDWVCGQTELEPILARLVQHIALTRRSEKCERPLKREWLRASLNKHEIQGCGIWCRLVQDFGISPLKTESIIIELGAGRGGLGQWMLQTEEEKRLICVLVERESRQNRREDKNADAQLDHSLLDNVIRLRLDISDFDASRCVDFLTASRSRGREELLDNK